MPELFHLLIIIILVSCSNADPAADNADKDEEDLVVLLPRDNGDTVPEPTPTSTPTTSVTMSPDEAPPTATPKQQRMATLHEWKEEVLTRHAQPQSVNKTVDTTASPSISPTSSAPPVPETPPREEIPDDAVETDGDEQVAKETPLADDMTTVNFASAECGAKVLTANPEAKSISAVVKDDKDKYLLNLCAAKKWVVIELCEEVLVEKVGIGCFELFSGLPRDVLIVGSEKYPTSEWSKLGQFRAKEERSLQRFTIAEPLWVRFLMVRIVSHYGNEHFCPLSVVEARGRPMLQDFKEEMEIASKEVLALSQKIAGSGEVVANATEPESSPEPTIEPLIEKEEEESDENVAENEYVVTPTRATPDVTVEPSPTIDEATPTATPTPESKVRKDHIFKTLTKRIKELEINTSLINQYVDELSGRYVELHDEMEHNHDDSMSELQALAHNLTMTCDALNDRIATLENMHFWYVISVIILVVSYISYKLSC